MSEKESSETTEEQIQETSEELQEVKTEEASQELEAAEEEVQEQAAPPAPAEKKGLMQRRPSFAQSSVPNAHKGYSTTPPVIMLLIISVFVLLSIIFATAAVGN